MQESQGDYLNELIQEDGESMLIKDFLNDPKSYDRSYSLPEVLKNDMYTGEVHIYAAKRTPVFVDKCELKLHQAQKPELQFEWPLWLEAIRMELTSLIVTNVVLVFEPIKIDDVPVAKRNKIFNLLIILKRKRDQHHKITKYKVRLVMDGSRAHIGDPKAINQE